MICMGTGTLQKKVMTATLALLSLGALQANANDAVDVALSKCAGIDDDSARLSCYDALATVLVEDSPSVSVADENSIDPAGSVAVAAAATAVTAEAAGAVPITDDVGKERIEPTPDEEQPKFSAKVVACTKSVQSGQYYFTFENGQVWKQSNYRSLNLRDCDFDVEVSKGGFGYQMYILSKDRTVRVARVK